MTSLNISANKLTRGKAKYANSDPNKDEDYETDVTGMNTYDKLFP